MRRYKYSMLSLPISAFLGIGWALICQTAVLALEPVEVDRSIVTYRDDKEVLVSSASDKRVIENSIVERLEKEEAIVHAYYTEDDK